MKRINALTGLRFIMCMMIVVSHLVYFEKYSISIGENSYNLYHLMFYNAQMAVMFFFIMSGFGLTYRAYTKNDYVSSKKITPRVMFNFTWKQIKKIYFIYLISMAVMIPLAIYTNIADGEDIKTALIKTIVKVLIAPTLLQSAAANQNLTNILNSVCWFLSVLTILYFIYPLLEKINVKFILGKRKAKICFFVVLILRILMKYVFSLVAKNTIFDQLDYASPYLRVFDFTLGILICDIVIEQREKHNKNYVNTYVEFLAIILVFVWWMGRNCLFNGEFEVIKQAVDIIVACFAVYVFSFENGKISKILGSKPLVLLGNVTMYIYIWHYPATQYLRYLFGAILQEGIVCDIITTIGIIIITVLLTFVCYKAQKKKADKKINEHID